MYHTYFFKGPMLYSTSGIIEASNKEYLLNRSHQEINLYTFTKCVFLIFVIQQVIESIFVFPWQSKLDNFYFNLSTH